MTMCLNSLPTLAILDQPSITQPSLNHSPINRQSFTINHAQLIASANGIKPFTNLNHHSPTMVLSIMSLSLTINMVWH